MGLRNAFDAAPGRTVEVICGDLFEERIDVDLLVISAWENHYEPDPGSMVAVLRERCGIVVGELPRQLDLSREPTIRGWVTPPLEELTPLPMWPKGSETKFRRLAVVESPMDPLEESTEQSVFRQLFCLLALMPLQGITCTSVATPLLNTGRQKAQPEALYPAMIKAVENGLRHLPDLRRLVIFDLKKEPLEILCSRIDEALGRTDLQRERLSLNTDHPEQLQQLLKVLDSFQHRHPEVVSHPEVRGYFNTILQQLHGDEVTLVTLAITARKLLEVLIAQRLKGRGKDLNLFGKINRLSPDISAWSVSAMHTVRTFGNWMGHASDLEDTDAVPQRGVEASDLLLMLLALQRVLNDYPWRIRPGGVPFRKSPQRKSPAML